MKKRKGILGLLALVGVAVMSLAGCTQQASNPKVDNWDKYQQQKSITVGFDNTFVPMDLRRRMAIMPALISNSRSMCRRNSALPFTSNRLTGT